MHKIKLRAAYNATLLNFIDNVSQWDEFVSSYSNQYYKKHYKLTSKDQVILDSYAKIRKYLDWEKEIELFNWAYNNFPNTKEFNGLLNLIKYFENKTNNKNITLKSELNQATKKLKDLIPDIEKSLQDLNIEETLRKFAKLLKSNSSKKPLICYLTYSPDKTKTQGGANGDGIYTEVSVNTNKDNQITQTIETIVHEYLHKEIHPGDYFRKLAKTYKKNIYLKKFTNIYPDIYHQFTEEAVVYTICDCIIFNHDPKKQLVRYKKDDPEQKHEYSLWKAVCGIEPILKSYTQNNQDKKETLKKLDLFFTKYTSTSKG